MDNSNRIRELYAAKKHYQKKAIHDTAPPILPASEVKPVRLNHYQKIQPSGLSRELFEYQKEGVGFLESRNGRAIIGDDMGLGKTAQSLAYLQLHLKARPAVIICPSSLKLNWCLEIFKWMERKDANLIYLLGGKTKKTCEEVSIKGSGRLIMRPCKVPKSGIFIINYDVMPDWAATIKGLKAEIFLLDEVQTIKSKKAARSKAVLALAKGVPKIIAMTGTLIENRPAEAYNAIHMIDPTLFPSEWKYKNRYCDPKFNGFGWSYNGSSNTIELHNKISNICIRRLKIDVLKDLPPKIRVVVPLELDNRAEYTKAENHLIAWIKENKGLKQAKQASKVEALARINELKQLSAKGKLESSLDWIEDYLSEGAKLVVFAVNTFILDAVQYAFPDCSVRIDGSVTGTKRNDAVDQFQNNPKIRLMIGNIQAAGVGLTLTAAYATCFLQLPWTPSAVSQAADRVHRIGQTAECVFTYFLLGTNTIEIEVAEMIDKKQKVLDAVLDGVKSDEEGTIINELIKSLSEN